MPPRLGLLDKGLKHPIHDLYGFIHRTLRNSCREQLQRGRPCQLLTPEQSDGYGVSSRTVLGAFRGGTLQRHRLLQPGRS